MSKFHWASDNERGNRFFLLLTYWIVKYCPLIIIRFITFWVVLYFFLTSKKKRKYIQDYQYNLSVSFPHIKFTALSVFKQFLQFGEAITDRFAVWQHKICYQDLIIDDEHNLYDEMDKINQRGQILICSHLGNIEICRALLGNGHHSNFKLNVLVYNKHAREFNKALEEAGADKLPVISVDELDPQKMMELKQRIDNGEWIAIAADRIPIRGGKTEKVKFLGKLAMFPQGAWLLASIFKVPINTVFCFKKNGQYHLKLRRFSSGITGHGHLRQKQIAEIMQQYVNLLEKECANNPLFWFNFYDFWYNDV